MSFRKKPFEPLYSGWAGRIAYRDHWTAYWRTRTLAIAFLIGILIGFVGGSASRAGVHSQGFSSPVAMVATPAPAAVTFSDTRAAPADTPAPATPSPTADPGARRSSRSTPRPILSGYATWYATGPGCLCAAAGPLVRQSLGAGWRGASVTVCGIHGDVCERVTLVDFCACGPRHGEPTLLDLSDEAFVLLAPLSVGVIAVTVRW